MFGLRLLTLKFGNQLMNELHDVVANKLETMRTILETYKTRQIRRKKWIDKT